ncbi:MAG: hypothetical protein ABIS86_18555 [Streptosporangiaceae bacterium]
MTRADQGFRLSPAAAAPRRGPRWPWLALGASVAALAVTVAAGFLVLSGSDSGEDWQPAGRIFAADPAARFDGRDQELTAVATSGTRVVAVGGEPADFGKRAIFVISVDSGRTFRAATVRTVKGEPASAGDVPDQVAAAPNGWVALGRSVSGATVVWTSQDGAAWTRQSDQSGAQFGSKDRVRHVAWSGKAFIATGATTAKGDFTDAAPVVWLSADGTSWKRVAGWQLHPPARGTLEFTDIAWVANAIVLKGVSSVTGDVTWRSGDDGATWQEFAVPKPKGARDLHVAASDTDLFAVRGLGATAKVYGSTDGLTWRALPDLAVPGQQSVLKVTGTGGTVTAAVVTDRRVDLVSSIDGGAWAPAGSLTLPERRQVLDVAAAEGTTILAGRESGGDDLDAMLVVRDERGEDVRGQVNGLGTTDRAVTALAWQDGQVAAAGSTDGDAAIWISRDGEGWQRASGQAMSRTGAQRLTGLAAGPSGWLGVGVDGGTRPLVLTSRTGTGWEQADQVPAFAPAGKEPLVATAAAGGPQGYVIVGQDGYGAAAWYSVDLQAWERGTPTSEDNLKGTQATQRWMNSVTTGRFGFLAAGGVTDPRAYGGVFVRRPAVWSAPDGRTWTLNRLPIPDGVNEGRLTHIVSRGDLVLAVGTAVVAAGARTVSLAYLSPDGGRSWQPVTLPAEAGQNMIITAVTSTDAGIVVAGAIGRPQDVVLWTSKDGRAWTLERPAGPGANGQGDQVLTALTSFGKGLLGVGSTTAGGVEEPTLLMRP